MSTLLKRYDPEGVPEKSFEFFFRTWDAEKLKPGDTIPLDEMPYLVIDIKRNVEDPKFKDPITVVEVKKIANN